MHVTTTDISLALLLGPQLKTFSETGYDVVAASAPGPFVNEIESTGAKFVPLSHATRSVSPTSDVKAMAELYRLFRRIRPDIVHTHNPKPGIYGRLAAAAARVPVVVNTVHGLYTTADDPLPRRVGVLALERVAAACSDAELVQNPEDLATLAAWGVPSGRLHLLGNGIDLERFRRIEGDEQRCQTREELGIKPGSVIVLSVGRLVKGKGYPELFEAAAIVRATHPEAVFLVAGPSEPSKGDALDAADMEAARKAGVVFAGHRPDIERLYAASDVFVLASHREGFPRAAMEASAMGLPVVATDIRGCRQVVEQGLTGLLVPVKQPRSLADAICSLVEDPVKRGEMGSRGIEKAMKEFDQRTVIGKTLDIYALRLNNQA